MNKKTLATIIIVVVIFLTTVSIMLNQKPTSKNIDQNAATEGLIEITNEANFLFKAYTKQDHQIIKDGQKTWQMIIFELDPAKMTLYKEIGILDGSQKAAVLAPLFTATAYKEPGFYTYYRGECDKSCLTRSMSSEFKPTSSVHGLQIFKLLGYDVITDLDVEHNPDILKQFDKIILLHNEYVTKKEFDAIISHPKVVYLYPNALYAEVRMNNDDTITLIRGHNYPEQSIRNGFDWIYDNSELEYDMDCSNMVFKPIPNGIMLNCYPENEIMVNPQLLKIIKDF